MKIKNTNIRNLKKEIIIPVNPKVYPLGSIYGAAYVFLDKAYIFLEGNPKKEILVHIKGKEKLRRKDIKLLGEEFLNELLNCSLRHMISKNNRKIREYIVGAALIGISGENVFEEKKSSKKEEWKKDPLEISVPWEEKFSERVKNKKTK